MPASHSAFVDSIPALYDELMGPALFVPYAEDLAQRLSPAGSLRVLEVACGTGIVTRRLLDRLPPSATITATDLNEPMLAQARPKFRETDPVTWKQEDATALSFADASFDAVVCQFGWMFFPDKALAAREACRVLKPGGRLLLNVWDAIEKNDFARIAHETINRFFPGNPIRFYEIPFGFHDADALRATLADSEFEDVQIERVELESVSPAALDIARELVEGNAVLGSITERDASLVPAIRSAVASALAAECGSAPAKGRMQALVCSAVSRRG